MLIRDLAIVTVIIMLTIISTFAFQKIKKMKSSISLLPINIMKLYSTVNHNNNYGKNDVKLNLYDELKSWRKRISDELQTPIYQIFPNKVLEAIVIQRPKSLNEFKDIKGVGPVKLKKYGRTILDMVLKHISDEGIDLETMKDIHKKEDTSFWYNISLLIYIYNTYMHNDICKYML